VTAIHVQFIGDQALISQSDLERLVELAQRSEAISVEKLEDDLPTIGLMRLMEQSGAFDFWKQAGEDVYSATDGEAV
jgi:hypothetical protein